MSTAPQLPHDVRAEAVLLGACVVENAVIASAQAALVRDDFYAEKHRLIWDGIEALTERSEPVDLVTLRAQLQREDKLEGAGGVKYLAAILDGVPRMASVTEWAGLIRQAAQQRALISAAHKLVTDAHDMRDPAEAIADMDARLHTIGARGNEGRGPLDNHELAAEAMRAIDARTAAHGGVVGYRTGLKDLDSLLLGIRPGRLGVIGARLGNGKSMLALGLAAAIAKQEPTKAVLFVSLEMDGVELTERRFAAESGVEVNRLWYKRPDQAEESWRRLSQAYVEISGSNLRIVEDAWTVPEIAQHARSLRSSSGLAAVFVDYFQLLEGTGKRYESRTVELAGISHSLRKLAKQMDVPFIVVAQLNREAADRKGKHKPPEIHEIEGTDALGKDAHWTVLIDPGRGQDEGTAELYLRKNRGGPKGRAGVVFNGACARFEDWGPA